MIEQVLEMAWESIRTESAWRCLENDPELRSVILTRIRVMEEAKVKEAKDRLQADMRKVQNSPQTYFWDN